MGGRLGLEWQDVCNRDLVVMIGSLLIGGLAFVPSPAQNANRRQWREHDCDVRYGHAESRLLNGPTRDLSQDERAGGHILRKHVGQTEEDLRERLGREQHITGASTYTDRATAEHVVGAAIAESQDRNSALAGARAGIRTWCWSTTRRSRSGAP